MSFTLPCTSIFLLAVERQGQTCVPEVSLMVSAKHLAEKAFLLLLT